jgi:hypothetical protein
MPSGTRLEGLHCAIDIDEPEPGVVLLTIAGTDVGELGEAPFRELAPMLAGDRRIELFIDARLARGPSIDVSSEWARWLADHRDHLHHVNMLTSSRLVRLTADFVRRFAGLSEAMRIHTDVVMFECALSDALGDSKAG